METKDKTVFVNIFDAKEHINFIDAIEFIWWQGKLARTIDRCNSESEREYKGFTEESIKDIINLASEYSRDLQLHCLIMN